MINQNYNRTKMREKPKNASILNNFANQKRKKLAETNISNTTGSTSAYQSTKCDSAKDRTNLNRPNIVPDNIAIIFPHINQSMAIDFIC